MGKLLLGQFDFDDWIQLIIFILIAGGAAFSAVAKALIKKFSPEQRSDGDGGPSRGMPTLATPGSRTRDAIRRERGHGTPARPVPPQPATRPAAGPPVARPYPATLEALEQRPEGLPEVLAEVFPELVAPLPPEAVSAQPRQGPASPPPQPPATLPQRPARLESRPVVKRKRPPKPKREPEQAQERLGHLAHHLGHLKTGIRPGIEPHVGTLVESGIGTYAAAAEAGAQIDPIRHPTHASLRHAIIMSEILAPPLALRPPDDRF